MHCSISNRRRQDRQLGGRASRRRREPEGLGGGRGEGPAEGRGVQEADEDHHGEAKDCRSKVRIRTFLFLRRNFNNLF
jgi:hypothetical protein